MALARAVDAVGPVQAGVEPLRGVRRRLLGRQHVAQLVEEGLRVLLAVEIAALPAPIGPGAGEPVEDLARIGLADRCARPRAARRARPRRARSARGRRGRCSPRPAEPRGHAGLAEIFLGNDVAGHLAPGRRASGCSPAGRRSSRPGCGSRSSPCGTAPSRKANVRPSCSGALCAFCAPFSSGPPRRSHPSPGPRGTPSLYTGRSQVDVMSVSSGTYPGERLVAESIINI